MNTNYLHNLSIYEVIGFGLLILLVISMFFVVIFLLVRKKTGETRIDYNVYMGASFYEVYYEYTVFNIWYFWEFENEFSTEDEAKEYINA